MKKILKLFCIIVIIFLFNIEINIYAVDNEETEIDIPDENLKEYLIRNFDDDKNGLITGSDLKKIQYLNLTNYYKPITNLEGLQYMTNLESFYISGKNQVSIDLSPIYGIKGLKSLTIDDNNITDISFLSNFENLKYVKLYGNPINLLDESTRDIIYKIEQNGGYVSIEDTTPIVNFENVELKNYLLNKTYADKNNDKKISEYEMSKVSYITVNGNINDLKYARELKNLYIASTTNNKTQDLSPIYNLKYLEYLYIENSEAESKEIDCSKLNNLTKLGELHLENVHLNNINYYYFPQFLTILHIGTDMDFDILKIGNLENLNKLHIHAPGIDNIELIKNFTHLNDLELSFSQVDEDLNIDSMMNAIEQLNLQNVKVNGQVVYNLGTFKKGKNVEVMNIKDICSITKAIYNPESKFYVENPEWKTYGIHGWEDVGDTIEIDTSIIGKDFTKTIFLGNDNKAFVGDIIIKWNVVNKGDINGDGKVNGKDWNRLYEHVNETNLLTGEEFNCADVNGDGKVNGKDWNRIYEHINETNLLY